MKTKRALITIRMGCDDRVPRNAMGYVEDLTCELSEAMLADRLNQLRKYVPELVEEWVSV